MLKDSGRQQRCTFLLHMCEPTKKLLDISVAGDPGIKVMMTMPMRCLLGDSGMCQLTTDEALATASDTDRDSCSPIPLDKYCCRAAESKTVRVYQ
jgi:hypothetical protein